MSTARKDRESSPTRSGSANSGNRENSSRRPFLTASRQLSAEVAEKKEGRRRAPFLAHEQHRYLRSEQVDACKRPDGLGRSQHVQPFAKRAIADLVVILDERHERVWRQFGARAAARRVPIRHHLALIGEAFGDGFSQELRRAVGGVVAAALMRGGDVENVVNVVVPLRGVEIGLAAVPRQTARNVVLVFQEEMDGPREIAREGASASSSSRSGRESSLMAWTASKRSPSR